MQIIRNEDKYTVDLGSAAKYQAIKQNLNRNYRMGSGDVGRGGKELYTSFSTAIASTVVSTTCSTTDATATRSSTASHDSCAT